MTQKETPEAATNDIQAQNTGENDAELCSTIDAERKRLATIRAQAALRAIELHALAGSGFLIVWRGIVREVASLDDAEHALRRMGVADV